MKLDELELFMSRVLMSNHLWVMMNVKFLQLWTDGKVLIKLYLVWNVRGELREMEFMKCLLEVD